MRVFVCQFFLLISSVFLTFDLPTYSGSTVRLAVGPKTCTGCASFISGFTLANRLIVLNQIKSFGGDPAKVTLWGQSAGAGSITLHLLANGGNTQPPLFRAAITSSTFLPSLYPFNDRIPEVYISSLHSNSFK